MNLEFKTCRAGLLPEVPAGCCCCWQMLAKEQSCHPVHWMMKTSQDRTRQQSSSPPSYQAPCEKCWVCRESRDVLYFLLYTQYIAMQWDCPSVCPVRVLTGRTDPPASRLHALTHPNIPDAHMHTHQQPHEHLRRHPITSSCTLLHLAATSRDSAALHGIPWG